MTYSNSKTMRPYLSISKVFDTQTLDFGQLNDKFSYSHSYVRFKTTKRGFNVYLYICVLLPEALKYVAVFCSYSLANI